MDIALMLSGRLLMLPLFLLLLVKRTAQESCSSTFQVWKPDEDVLRQMEHMQLAVQNLSFYCQTQTARTEARIAEKVSQFHNVTWRLERDVMAMQVTRVDAQLQNTRLSSEASNLKKELDNTNRRVDDLELDLYMLRTQYKDTEPRQERAQLTTDMTSMLRSSVGDLKAEWLLIKREIDSLQRESRRLQTHHMRKQNSTQQVKDQVHSVSRGLQALEKRTFHSEDMLHKLEERVNKVTSDVDSVRAIALDLKVETDQQRNEMSSLQQGDVRLHKLLHELQMDTNRLKERQHLRHPSSSPAVSQSGDREKNSPRVISQSPAEENVIARDCHELYQTGHRTSGVYYIQPGAASYLVPVYCLMLNGTGHTVIHRRIDGLLNFNRRWLEYQYGFGNPYAEFWIGNDLLHSITHQKHYLLRVELTDWEGKRYYAEYSQFTVGDASQHYRLSVSGYNGDAGDSLSYHDKMSFSTEDVDNDLHTRHCAAENQGGWWFNACFSSNLNGVYHKAWYMQTSSNYADGVVWYTAKDSEFYSMKGVVMMLKPRAP